MKKSTLLRLGASHALGVLIYIVLLSIFFEQANSWFGETDKKIFSPIAALMLFIFSALLTGSLVLARPIMLYIDGQKKDAIKLFLFTGLSIFILTVIAFSALMIIK